MTDTLHRVKIYRMGWRHLITLLSQGIIGLPKTVTLPAFIHNIPKGAKVRNVYHDPGAICISIVVEHPDFPPVPEGTEIPVEKSEVLASMKTYTVVNDQYILDLDGMSDEEIRFMRDALIEEYNVRQAVDKVRSEFRDQ